MPYAKPSRYETRLTTPCSPSPRQGERAGVGVEGWQ